MSKRKLAEKLNIPEDVVYGRPVVTVTGIEEIYVENSKGILEYHKSCIRILTKEGHILFLGDELEIVYYSNTDMKIKGKIESINYS